VCRVHQYRSYCCGGSRASSAAASLDLHTANEHTGHEESHQSSPPQEPPHGFGVVHTAPIHAVHFEFMKHWPLLMHTCPQSAFGAQKKPTHSGHDGLFSHIPVKLHTVPQGVCGLHRDDSHMVQLPFREAQSLSVLHPVSHWLSQFPQPSVGSVGWHEQHCWSTPAHGPVPLYRHAMSIPPQKVPQ